MSSQDPDGDDRPVATKDLDTTEHRTSWKDFASSTYIVNARPRPNGSTVRHHVDAYPEDDARRRVLDQYAYYPEPTIVSVVQVGDLAPVDCTYEGGNGAAYPEGPWVFMDWIDKSAPLIACDIHGLPAHPIVYDTAVRDKDYAVEQYSGTYQHHPVPLDPGSMCLR